MGGPPSLDPRQAPPGPYRESAPYSPAQVASPDSTPFCTPESRPALGTFAALHTLQPHCIVPACLIEFTS